MTSVPTLAKAEARFIDALIAAHRRDCGDPDCGQDTPAAIIDSLGDGDHPAVVEGRIVRIKLSWSVPEVIDLRGLDALEEVTIDADDPNEALILGAHPRLTTLRYESDAVAANLTRAPLDLAGCTALREAHLDGAMITALRGIPASLHVLSIRYAPVTTLDLSTATGLERLVASKSALTSLELSRVPRLRELWIDGTPLARLDLRPATALTTLAAAGAPLAELDLRHMASLAKLSAGGDGRRIAVRLPRPSALADLRITGGELEEFDTREHPALRILMLPRGGLRSVVADHPTLHWLDVEDNQLTTLDLGKLPATRCLQLDGNPLARVDITPLAKLTRDRAYVSFPAQATIACTERQQRTIPALCERAGLSKPTSTLAKMDAYLLHDYASTYNWDDGPKRLREVIEHPRCDLATALQVYWMSEPAEYAAYSRPSDVPASERHAKPWVELLRAIEARVTAGKYPSGAIPFDARDVDDTDLSDDDARIPAAMRAPIRVAAGAVVELPPAAAAKKPSTKNPAAKKPAAKKPAAKKPAAKKRR